MYIIDHDDKTRARINGDPRDQLLQLQLGSGAGSPGEQVRLCEAGVALGIYWGQWRLVGPLFSQEKQFQGCQGEISMISACFNMFQPGLTCFHLFQLVSTY